MVDIKVRKARVYFSVENKAKMGVEGFDMLNIVSRAKTASF